MSDSGLMAGGIKNTDAEIRDGVLNDATKFAGADVGTIADLVVDIPGKGGTIYFVGVGGNDGNSGLTWANRRLTVASGYGLCANGDTLIIGPGTYTEDLTFNTDGVTVLGAGVGLGTTVGGTEIDGTAIMTCGHNIFKGIYFFDFNTGAAVVTTGNDADAKFNEFYDCQIRGMGTCTSAVHMDGTAGGCCNIFRDCLIAGGTSAALLIDNGVASESLVVDCIIETNGVAGHGIHNNHASAIRNVYRNCIVHGKGTTGTGIYIQAGTDCVVTDCKVEDCTTDYSIVAGSFLISSNTESKITADNTNQDDFKAIYDKTSLINSASGSGTLNDANVSDTIIPSSLPTKMHLIFDISNLNNNADDFDIEVEVGAAASERVVSYYNLTSDGVDITADTGSGVGSVIKQRRIDISNILVYTGEQVIVTRTKNSVNDRNVNYKYLCGV